MRLTTNTARRDAFLRLEAATDLPLAALALLVVPALVLEERGTSEVLRRLAHGVNWVVWLAFCAEFIGKAALSQSPWRYARQAWIDLLIIVLSPPFLVPSAMQGMRAIRVIRALRLLRFVRAAAVAAIGLRQVGQALSHRRFHVVAIITSVLVGLGALGIFVVESGHNGNIRSLGDALWWAVVTVTTVGYGDVSPVTTEGRLIAVVLMTVGVGFIGLFTASVTSFFMQPDKDDAAARIEARLVRIEEQLSELLQAKYRQ